MSTIIIIGKAKQARQWAATKARGLWKSWTARANAVIAAVTGAALSIPFVGELWAMGLSGLSQALQSNIGLLLPALEPKTAAVTAFTVSVAAVILRGRTAGK
jgi:hypothetical protein